MNWSLRLAAAVPSSAKCVIVYDGKDQENLLNTGMEYFEFGAPNEYS